MQRRLGNIIVGYTRERKPVYARDLEADGLMTVLLKDALAPNLVQTLKTTRLYSRRSVRQYSSWLQFCYGNTSGFEVS